MSTEVDVWLGIGRNSCALGHHWYILDYGDYLICPVCGSKQDKELTDMTEYNAYLVKPDYRAVQ